MEIYNFAIDLDSDRVSIYKNGDGIVLSEPAIVVGNTKNMLSKPIFVGEEALAMMGKIDNYDTIYPINCGKIVDFESCVLLINRLLAKVEEKSIVKKRNLIFLVPCGLDTRELSIYRDLGYALSSKNVKLIPKVLAISKLNQKKDKLSNMYINLAKDYFDVAVVYNDSIIKGYTIDLGYNVITSNIEKYIFETKQIEVNTSILDSITTDLATMIPNDNIEEKYSGIEAYSKQFIDFKLSSLEVINYYTSYASEVCDIIEAIIKTLSSEVLAEVKVAGALITGKLTKISGMSKFLSNRLNLKVEVNDNEIFSSLLGIGSLLNDVNTLEKLEIKNC